MKSAWLKVGMCIVMVAGLAGTLVAFQAPQAEEPPAFKADEALDEAMAQAMEASKPGDEHKAFEPMIGTFTTQATWMLPGAEPMHAAGLCENKWILGGRFMESNATGGGKSMVQSKAIFGYDTRINEYFALGIDTLGTYYVNPSGSYHKDSKSFILEGEELEPEMGMTIPYTQTFHIVDENTHTMELTITPPEMEPIKVCKVVFNRKK